MTVTVFNPSANSLFPLTLLPHPKNENLVEISLVELFQISMVVRSIENEYQSESIISSKKIGTIFSHIAFVNCSCDEFHLHYGY